MLREKELKPENKTKESGTAPHDFGDAQNEIPKEAKRTNSREYEGSKKSSDVSDLKIDITFDDNMSSFKPDSFNYSYESNSFFDNINQKTH